MQDLIQEVSLQLILNNYTITKECYKIVRKYIYKKNRDIIELVIDKDEEEEKNNSFISLQDKKAYINFINSYNETEKTKTFDINELLQGFTDRQIEIISMYSKTNSMQKVADLLGISKGTINNTIRRLREKINIKQYEIA